MRLKVCPTAFSGGVVDPRGVQVRADAYEKVDKELMGFVEDVLLNRCDNATERMLEYAALLEPKSKPTDVRKKGQVRELSGL